MNRFKSTFLDKNKNNLIFFYKLSMSSSPIKPYSSYSSFNFLELDNKLNIQKKEQQKRQKQQRDVLSLVQKKLPNIKLQKQFEKLMNQYKDHYTINRKFTIYNQDVKEKPEKYEQKLNQENPQLQKYYTHHFPLLKSSSTDRLLTNQRLKRKLQQGHLVPQNILKPLKPNDYLSLQGTITLKQTCIQHKQASIQLKAKAKGLEKPLQLTHNGFIEITGFRVKQFTRILSLTKQQLQQNQKNELPKQRKILKNPSIVLRERKKALKLKFRYTVFLILSKLKLMKLTIKQIIEHKIFDKTIPYKFGKKIFHAVKQGDESMVFRILMQNRLALFDIDSTGKTTLMWACIRGYHKIVQLLLANGVEPHSKDVNGRSAMHFSQIYNHPQCTKIMFIYSYYVESNIQSINLSEKMRKIMRTGLQSFKTMRRFESIDKRKEFFEQQFKYYFKQ